MRGSDTSRLTRSESIPAQINVVLWISSASCPKETAKGGGTKAPAPFDCRNAAARSRKWERGSSDSSPAERDVLDWPAVYQAVLELDDHLLPDARDELRAEMARLLSRWLPRRAEGADLALVYFAVRFACWMPATG